MPRGCVNRIRLWPLRRDYRSGVLIGAGGERRCDWPVHMLANDVSTLLTLYSAFLWPVLKIVLGIVLSNFFKSPLH